METRRRSRRLSQAQSSPGTGTSTKSPFDKPSGAVNNAVTTNNIGEERDEDQNPASPPIPNPPSSASDTSFVPPSSPEIETRRKRPRPQSQQIEQRPSFKRHRSGNADLSALDATESDSGHFDRPQPRRRPLSRSKSNERKVLAPELRRYIEVLNHEIKDANIFEQLTAQAITNEHDLQYLAASQFGVVKWSASQKYVFFAALERYGLSRVDLVAQATGKSLLEIMQYLGILKDAEERRGGLAEKRARYDQRKGKLKRERKRYQHHSVESDTDRDSSPSEEEDEKRGTVDVQIDEAAWEISPDCEARLDEVAEKVLGKELYRDTKSEEIIWGKDWLVNEEVAASWEEAVKPHMRILSSWKRNLRRAHARRGREGNVDTETGTDQSDTGNEDDDLDNAKVLPGDDERMFNEIKTGSELNEQYNAQLLAPSTLLHPTNLLMLSTRIFMNPGPPLQDQNWYHLQTKEHPSPAIFATALTDLYNLTIIVTRRLVSATLFQANARIRAKGSTPLVTPADVRAARRVLKWKEGLKLSSGSKSEKEAQPKTQHDNGPYEYVEELLQTDDDSMWKRYWRGVPRRMKLRVFEHHGRKAREHRLAFSHVRRRLDDAMSYDDVETKLALGGGRRQRYRRERTEIRELDEDRARGEGKGVAVTQDTMIGDDEDHDEDEDDDDNSDGDNETDGNDEHIEDEQEEEEATQEDDNSSITPSDSSYRDSSSPSPSRATSTPFKHQRVHTTQSHPSILPKSASSSFPSSSSTRSSISPSHHEDDEEKEGLALESRLDVIDLQHSRREEMRLWRLMELEPPGDLRSAADSQAEKDEMSSQEMAEIQARKVGRKFIKKAWPRQGEWMEMCEYRAEWERYGRAV